MKVDSQTGSPCLKFSPADFLLFKYGEGKAVIIFTSDQMRLVKVRKKVFKREFLDYRLLVVIFDMYEISDEDETTILEHNRNYWVIPTTRDNEDLDVEMIQQKIMPQKSR